MLENIIPPLFIFCQNPPAKKQLLPEAYRAAAAFYIGFTRVSKFLPDSCQALHQDRESVLPSSGKIKQCDVRHQL